jgi:catechol 2,3-dioxygenase-like lactoylglutathione lyase family enzyme
MSTPTVPQVECERHHPSPSVSDVVAAADFYTKKLGLQLAFTWGDTDDGGSESRSRADIPGGGHAWPPGVLSVFHG